MYYFIGEKKSFGLNTESPNRDVLFCLCNPFSTILDPGFTGGGPSNRPCPSVGSLVRGSSVFKYLRDRSLVFSNFLHEVRAP